MRALTFAGAVAVLVCGCGSKPGTPTTPTIPKVVSGVAVTGTGATLPVGQVIQLGAVATYSDGSTGVVTSATTWSSNAPTIATVDAGGTLRTFRTGAATITATHSGRTGAAGLTVQLATEFGSGQWLLGSMIGAGRYYADPASGCYWERESGLGGTLGEILANDFVGFDAGQLIVDVLAGDVAFKTEAACGTWFPTPRAGAKSTITPGTWLVGAQLQSGTYQASATTGCYWERVTNFTGTLSAIIANDFAGGPGLRQLSIASTDAGFTTTVECGTWTRVGPEPSSSPIMSTASITENLNRHAQRVPRQLIRR